MARFRDVRRLPHDVGDRVPILLGHGHVHPRHQRKMKRHVAFVRVTEIRQRVLRPLVGFRQEEGVRVAFVQRLAKVLNDGMGFWQVLVVRAVPLDQVGNGVQPQPVDPHVEPEPHHVDNRLNHPRVVEVQVRLVAEEPMPVVLAGFRIPGPVRLLGIGEDDAGLRPFLVVIRPEIPVAKPRPLLGRPGALEPGVLVRRVVDDQLGDDLQATIVCFANESSEVPHRPVGLIDAAIVGNVVPVVAQR